MTTETENLAPSASPLTSEVAPTNALPLQAPDGAAAAPPSPAEAPRPSAAPDIHPARLDPDAVRVLLRLRQHGFEAFLVGGCVRDLLIGRTPKDFDIATSATPADVRALFRNCRLIGRRFRLAHVYFKGGKILEVSTFRTNPAIVEDPPPSEVVEGEVHSPGVQHVATADQEALAALERGDSLPENTVDDAADEAADAALDVAALDVATGGAEAAVESAELALPPPGSATPEGAGRDVFITEDNTFGTALEDARRRDFTINGLFYEPQQGRVIDYVQGLRDLALREIRTIGDPEQRIREDPVRLLRAVRFAGKLGFDIESWTYAAMEGAVEDLPRCAPPRLLEETFRLIRGGHASPSMRLLVALDAMKFLLPPIDEYLRRQEPEGFEEYFRLVAIMDGLVREGAAFDDSMLLASILLPLALEENGTDGAPSTDEARAASLGSSVDALLQELVQKARLPRRIAERARLILMAQRVLAGLRRRRGGLQGFRVHPLFREALRVFEVWVLATGEFEEALAKWKSGGAPSPHPNAQGPRRRRRRSRPGPGEPTTAGPGAPTDEPAAQPSAEGD